VPSVFVTPLPAPPLSGTPVTPLTPVPLSATSASPAAPLGENSSYRTRFSSRSMYDVHEAALAGAQPHIQTQGWEIPT
jgi:hypothetical protein